MIKSSKLIRMSSQLFTYANNYMYAHSHLNIKGEALHGLYSQDAVSEELEMRPASEQ